MNLTLSIDDDVLAAARRYAEAHGTSVQQLVRDHLAAVGSQGERAQALAELELLWATGTRAGVAAQPFSRDETYAHGVKNTSSTP